MGKSKNEENSIVLRAIRNGYNLPEAYLKTDVRKAVFKKDIITVLDLVQLTGSRLTNFYVETDHIRDADTISSLEQVLINPLSPYTKKLFSGFTGSGKTTELIKLCLEMQRHFNVIIFSAGNRLKHHELTIEALLFEILEDVLNYLMENKLVDESDELLKDIETKIIKWCSDIQVIKEEKIGKVTSRAMGLELLKVFFFSAKTVTNFFNEDIVKTTYEKERKINDLIFECNRIFDYLAEKTGKETLIIIDDLEKMPFITARDFYKRNAAFIGDFRCKMVMTIPVELVFHPDVAIIQGVFGNAEVLPMIKVKDRKGKPYQPGIDCLIKILEHRLDLSLFEDECYRDAVKYSGGAIRELFNIVQRAALIEKSDRITKTSMQKSVSYHKNTFSSGIFERRDEIKITFEEYRDALIDIYDGNKTNPVQSLALLDLLRTRAVMKYNGDGFYDTHPLLDSFIKAHKKKKEENG